MVPQFMNFYHYTAEQTLNEYAKTFFALMSQKNRIFATQRLSRITDNMVSQSDAQEARSIIKELENQQQGVDKYIKEAETIRNIKR